MTRKEIEGRVVGVRDDFRVLGACVESRVSFFPQIDMIASLYGGGGVNEGVGYACYAEASMYYIMQLSRRGGGEEVRRRDTMHAVTAPLCEVPVISSLFFFQRCCSKIVPYYIT